MKKITLLSMLCALTFIGTAQVDVTVGPLGILWGDLKVGADVALGENVSTELNAGFGGSSGVSDAGDNYDLNKLSFQGTAKYYFNPNNGADKFYAGVFVRNINRDYEYGEQSLLSDYKQNRVGGGFLIGHKVASDGGFIFDINLGFGRAFSDKVEYTDINGNQGTINWPDLMIVGKIGIGYRFGG